MPAPSVTNTFVNSSTADGTQVNTNFTDLVNALGDGTKDLTISALTVQGAAAFNGNTTIGNASTDTITYTGRVASDHVPISAAAYTQGTAALPFKAVYVGNGATDGGAVYFGSNATGFIKGTADGTEIALGGGVTKFDLAGAKIQELGYEYATASAGTTITDTDGLTVIYGTGAGTINLPTAADNKGRVIFVKYATGTSGLSIAVKPEGTETIDERADTFDLRNPNDGATFKCDGTNWRVLQFDTTERKFSSLTAEINTTGANSPVNGALSLTIGKGTWEVGYDISAQVYQRVASAGAVPGLVQARFDLGIGSAAGYGNAVLGCTRALVMYGGNWPQPTGGMISGQSARILQSITTNTTYFVQVACNVATASAFATIKAGGDSSGLDDPEWESVMWARRIG